MGLRKACSRVQTFPSPESETSLSNEFDQSFVTKLEDLQQLQGCRLSAKRLSKILDASIAAQKRGINLAMDAISPTTGSNSDRKFINCYLDSTDLLLAACNNIQLRLESIRSCLDSIPIGLHYLEGEHEPNWTLLQRAAEALESGRFRDKRHCSKMEKCMSRMRTFGKKLNEHTLAYEESMHSNISPELYKAMTGSWAMAVLGIGVLGSATSFRSLTSPRDKKMKAFSKKVDETESMEELSAADLATQTLLKLISAWQKGGSSKLRRMAVKAVGGELRRRREGLEKTLPPLEEKIGELYWQIVALRISIVGLLSKARKEEVFEMIKPSSCGESRMDTNQGSVSWIKIKKNLTRRASSFGRIVK